MRGTTVATVKHDYFIEDLGQPRGWFKAHRYHYSCLRCGWKFIVESWAGKVQALGERGELLSGPDAVRRVQSFTDGPCEPLPADMLAPRTRRSHNPPERKARPAVRRRPDGIHEIMAAK